MSKSIGRIKLTGRTRDKEIKITEFQGPESVGSMLQLTQGDAINQRDPDEPGFIQLSASDVECLIHFLNRWSERKRVDKRLLQMAKKLSDAFREWQKPNHGDFPSNEMMEALHEMDAYFPETKIEKG